MKIISRQDEWRMKLEKMNTPKFLTTPQNKVRVQPEFQPSVLDTFLSGLIIIVFIIGVSSLILYALKGSWDAGEYRSESSWVGSQEYLTGEVK